MNGVAQKTPAAPGTVSEEQIRTVEEQLERMNQIVGYQLQRAVKSTGSTALARRVDVLDVARRILKALEKVYAGRQMEVQCDIDPGIVFLGDERDLMEVLGNVLGQRVQVRQPLACHQRASHAGAGTAIEHRGGR
jgi:two-component system sensor histidine kinase PhoQ